MMTRTSLIAFAGQGADGLSVLFDTTGTLFQLPSEGGLRFLQEKRMDTHLD